MFIFAWLFVRKACYVAFKEILNLKTVSVPLDK